MRHNQRPKKAKITILFIHGIGNSGDSWNKVVEKMPSDVRVVTIDLLGFGESPRPSWAVYDAKTQARSVLATFFKLRITTPLIIVGHSLGSLVAIEIAKRYPLIIDSLILCSPPLYDSHTQVKRAVPRSDALLRRIYKSVQNHQEQFVQLAAFGMKYKLVNDSFNVTAENVDSYMDALRSMVINQTSYDDAFAITVPTQIIRGKLDPFVVTRNLNKLAKTNGHVTVTSTLAGHEMRGSFIAAVVAAINVRLKNREKSAIMNK